MIGNIERVANLFLTKTVYSVALAILVGIMRVPAPFLPRHITLIGALTIGVPAFFLALAPNTERARPGFVPRVLRMAVPAGLIAAGATFASYYVAYRDNGPDDIQNGIQDGTAAITTLFLVTMWVLAIVARPYAWWKIALIAAMTAGFLLAIGTPFGRSFFQLDPSDTGSMGFAIGIGLVAVAVIEVGWWLDGWLRQERRRLLA